MPRWSANFEFPSTVVITTTSNLLSLVSIISSSDLRFRGSGGARRCDHFGCSVSKMAAFVANRPAKVCGAPFRSFSSSHCSWNPMGTRFATRRLTKGRLVPVEYDRNNKGVVAVLFSQVTSSSGKWFTSYGRKHNNTRIICRLTLLEEAVRLHDFLYKLGHHINQPARRQRAACASSLPPKTLENHVL
jgi:hypothetical protein